MTIKVIIIIIINNNNNNNNNSNTCYLSSSCHVAHKASTQSRQPAPSATTICTSLQFFHPAFPFLSLLSSSMFSLVYPIFKDVILCLPKQGTTLAPREGCLRVFKVSVICLVLRGRVIDPPPNPQPGGPGAVLCLVSTP